MIRRITIRNFKGIRHLTLDTPDVLVLFGINNSGKSTILQALAVWSEVATAWIWGTESGVPRKIDLARDADDHYQSVNLVKTDFRAVPLYGLDHLWFGRVVEAPSCLIVEHSDWSIGFELQFLQNELITARPTDDTKENLLIHEAQQGCRDATYEPSRFPVAVPYPSPHRATPAYVVVTSSDLDTSRNKASVRGLSWISRKEKDLETFAHNPLRYTYVAASTEFRSAEQYLDRSGIPVALQRGNVAQLLRNVVYQVSQNSAQWQLLTDRMRHYYSCELMEPSPSDLIPVFYRENGRSTLYELSSAGDGLLQMLSVFATTLFSNPSLILIDEPDAHLHPLRQQEILPDLRRSFSDSQIICATHSPYVLTTVRPDEIVGVSRVEGEIRLVEVPPEVPSYGAEVGDVLASIMGVNERPKDNEFTTRLTTYVRLIAQDEGETEQAILLREELNSLSPRDPALDRADIEINRRRVLRQMREAK